MESFMSFVEALNSVLWNDYILYTLLGVGVLFTAWSAFGQYRSLTHGVHVIRGHYDKKGDPGAVNHFQALSTALSATVGLGNIAGVAIAVSIGGPGAVFWMWIVGFVGMALKLTEVTQSMLFRNIDDPDYPEGGPMWVCKRGLAKIHPSLKTVGTIVGGLFCVTLLTATVTSGNMFQAWNVADITNSYLGVPKIVTGVVLAILVGLTIIGGIKRIGHVAGTLVPFMSVFYILTGLIVIFMNIERIPEIFRLIFNEAFSPSEATGAFIGGTAGFGFMKGMQRALFSNEAGQGSAPIAHSAAKTDEPVREGVVAGLEPFIDTICVCTITAIVILLTGVWNRPPSIEFLEQPQVVATANAGEWTVPESKVKVQEGSREADYAIDGQDVFMIVNAHNSTTGGDQLRLFGTLNVSETNELSISWQALESDVKPEMTHNAAFFDYKGATLTAKAYDNAFPGFGFIIVLVTAWLFAISTMISWSYYGEQGSVYLFGIKSLPFYRIIFCILIVIASTPLVRTQSELDILSTMGTGVMLWVNIPVMLIFGNYAMKEYHRYIKRLKHGEFRDVK